MTPRLEWMTATVVEARVETPRARTVVVEVPAWPGHLAGQHVDVRLTADDGYEAQRSYSLASAPEDPRLALTVDRVPDGEVSPWFVDDVRVGDVFELRGPIGTYFVWGPEQRAPLLLVAGGSGVAPFRSILRHRAARGATAAPARLLYSARSPAEAIYLEELRARAAADATFELFVTYTREPPPGWGGPARRIDEALLREVAFAPGRAPDVYVCGPTSFVERAADGLVALGHAPERVRTERFGPSGP